jgi:hypothetical protein
MHDVEELQTFQTKSCGRSKDLADDAEKTHFLPGGEPGGHRDPRYRVAKCHISHSKNYGCRQGFRIRSYLMVAKVDYREDSQ